MSAVILLLTLGGWLIYSALKGQSLVESLTGKGGDTLDPKGGSVNLEGRNVVGSDPFGGNPLDALTGNIGAKAIVDRAVITGIKAGGLDVFVVSAYRPGDPLDHGSNDADKAARDIAVKGIDALSGPPSPKLDKAVVAIGRMFGRDYGNGRRSIIDTFNWRGFRIQIIWRTPAYGGHMGHIHIGVKKI